ncbi:restriction endonuclease subunit S [Paenibacillus rubinfantis]|uniref:restriction endonuclease subunit S n=1 Tax=Paenibacillus rubinfantis TaxID=1720296 RepID=UPI00073EB67E|nr:restriction endonuclease subunit S [Paenibacillus rubinfantis]
MSSWIVKRIGELCDEFGGLVQTGPFGSQLHASDYVEDGIPVVMPVNIGRNTVDPVGIARIRESDRVRLAKYQLQSGDIVYSRRGDIGRHAYVTANEEGWLCGTGCLFIRFNNPKVDPRFVSYFLDLPESVDYVYANAVGTTMPNLNTEILRSVPVRLPAFNLQKKIADILGAIDDNILLNRRMNETLEQMVIALYQHWFIDFGPFAEFGDNELPVGWRWGTLKEVGYVHKVQVDPSELEETRPYIGLEHMPKGNTSLEDWESSDKVTSHKSMFDKGDILFGKLRPYFKKVGVAPIDGVCSTDILVLKPVNKEFFGMLFGLVIQDAFIDYCTNTSGGTKMPRSDWKEMAKYSVPIPPESVREEFNQKIFSFVDQIISNIHANRTLIEMRDYLLPRLLSGEIEVKTAEEQVEEVLAGA